MISWKLIRGICLLLLLFVCMFFFSIYGMDKPRFWRMKGITFPGLTKEQQEIFQLPNMVPPVEGPQQQAPQQPASDVALPATPVTEGEQQQAPQQLAN